MHPTTTVKLKHGYVDADGKAHKTAVLRASTTDDLIKAEAVMIGMRASPDESMRHQGSSSVLLDLALVQQCVVSLGDIVAPKLTHLRALRRVDSNALIQALDTLDEGLTAEGEGKPD